MNPLSVLAFLLPVRNESTFSEKECDYTSIKSKTSDNKEQTSNISKPIISELKLSDEQRAEKFFSNIQEEVKFVRYINQENASAWAQTVAPYVFYAILPQIKSQVLKCEPSLASNALIAGIKVLELLPLYFRWKNPIFNSSLIQNVDTKGIKPCTMVYDKNGFPVHKPDGSPLIVLSTNKVEDYLGASISLFADGGLFLGLEVLVKTRAVYLATEDWKKANFYCIFKWRVDRLQELTEEMRSKDPTLDSLANKEENLCCLTGRVTVIPVMCQKGHLYEYATIEAYLLGNHTCPKGKEELKSEDLMFSTETFIRIHHKGE